MGPNLCEGMIAVTASLLLCCLFFFLLVKVDVLGMHLFECTCSSDRGPWAGEPYSRGVVQGWWVLRLCLGEWNLTPW